MPFENKFYIEFPLLENADLDSYADFTHGYIKDNNIESPVVICHSFGARVAIKYLTKYPDAFENLIIIGGAGLKPKRKPSYFFRVIKNKLYKKFSPQKVKGSKDYEALPPNIKKTFSNIVTEHLDKRLKRISVKTLLIYGDKDTETPLYMGKKFKRDLKNAEIYIVNNGTHFCYAEKPCEIAAVIKDFLCQ